MIAIFVDADACPVKREIYRVAERHAVEVHVVANSFIAVPRDPRIHLVVVGSELDAADDWIAERVDCRHIVITADIPLAARCLGVGARTLGPDGRPFTEDSIGDALAARQLHAELRAAQARGDELAVTGTLALHGAERPVVVSARRDARGWSAEVRLHQPDFGIRPYRAMLGTLRVQADVVVRVVVPAAAQ